MSYTSKKSEVLKEQLEVQELVLAHGDQLLVSVDSGNYEVDLGEAIVSAMMALVVPATGNVASIAISASENKLVIAQADFSAGHVVFKYKV